MARSDVLSIVGTWVATISVELGDQNPLAVDFVFRVADRPENRGSFVQGISNFLSGREPDLPRTGPLVPHGADAEAAHALLRLADDSMNQLGSLRECNNINGVVTVLDYNAPDLMRYTVAGGGESIIDGERQWFRREETWEMRPRAEVFVLPDFRYTDYAVGVRMEEPQLVDGRTYHVVSFYSTRDDADYWFWIDTENHRVPRLLMNVPPTHYIISTFDQFDRAQPIRVPKGPEDISAIPPQFRKRCHAKSTCHSSGVVGRADTRLYGLRQWGRRARAS